MTVSINTTRFRYWRWLIHLVGLIVPQRLRAAWRQEWEAELQAREQRLADWQRLDWRNKLDLFRRSTSATFDVLRTAVRTFNPHYTPDKPVTLDEVQAPLTINPSGG